MKCLVIQKEDKSVVISTSPNANYKGCEEKLLQDSTEYIIREGFEIVLPKDCESRETEACLAEYEKQGKHLNRYVEMDMLLSEYQMPQMTVPEGISFAFYEGPIEELHKAVAAVEEDWVQYFDGSSRYFCGFSGDKIVSFCIACYDEDCVIADGQKRIGSVGCVGTVPKYRKQGIGLYMVALATQELKENGCDRGFIHYTALENWYAKLGYESFMCFYM